MLFNDVIGQSALKKGLPELMSENRLAHALLFLGKEGSGALPLAIAFAQYVMCQKVNLPKTSTETTSSLFESSLFGSETPSSAKEESATLPLEEACNTCPSCLKMADMVHPDVHFSYPIVPKKSGQAIICTDYITEWREFIKSYPYGNVYDWLQFINAENKQGNISVHECNDIIRKLNLKSFEGGYKILIMWLPEYLKEAGNKLLKLIEEPPEKTLFILVAESDENILPTILSRCQIIKVPKLDDADIEKALVERNKKDSDIARRIASVSQGNYREALQMSQHADEDWQSLLREWLNAILKTGPMAQAKWVDEIAKLGREKQKQFLRYYLHLLQLALKIKAIPEMAVNYPSKDLDFAQRLNKIAGFSQIQAIADELDNAVYYIERNANAKMLFMALTIKIYYIIQNNIVLLND